MTQVPIYDPQAVEARWQARWVADHTNEPDLDRPRQPFYNLMMFPYPSAEGLHVGNMFAFTGADIYGRFKRHQGGAAFPRAMVLRDHALRRAAAQNPRLARLVRLDPHATAQLDRAKRGRRARVRDARRP